MNAVLEYLQTEAGSILNLWLTMQLQTGLFILLVLAVDLSFRNASPRFRYMLWMAALVKSMLPPILSVPVSGTTVGGVITLPTVDVAAIAAQGVGGGVPMDVILVAVLGLTSLGLALLAGTRYFSLRRYLRQTQPLRHDAWDAHPPVYVAEGIGSPLAVGLVSPRIYITKDIAEAPRNILHAVLHHEHAHIRRRDGLVVLLQTIVQVVYALNPLVWLLNLRLFRYREQICDDEALQRTETRPQDYGRLLVNFAEGQPARMLQTGTCFFETRRGFVQRISTLFQPAAIKRGKPGFRQYAMVILLVLLIAPASWKCSPDAPGSADNPAASEESLAEDQNALTEAMAQSHPDAMEVEVPPMIDGGLAALTANLEYPDEALKNELEGVVIIGAVIDENGRATLVHVKRGVHPALDIAAMNAVRKTRFTPGSQDGKPLKVGVNIPIKFRLQ